MEMIFKKRISEVGWRKYLVVFLITLSIFATALYVSNRLNDRKIDELRVIQEKISTDLLSSELQFALLAESSCEDLRSSFLSTELTELGSKISYAETNLNNDEEEIDALKKSYALLEIKDYLLTKRAGDKCPEKPVIILYFYSNDKKVCPDCEKTGFVLTRLRKDYPFLRVYSFDANLELAAQKTLISLHKISDTLPAVVIDGTVYYGFRTVDEMKEIIPNIESLALSTSTEEFIDEVKAE